MATVTEKPDGDSEKEVSLADFEKYYLEDAQHKYEWVDGVIIRTAYLSRKHLYIVANILRKFESVKTDQMGSLMQAVDCHLSDIPSYRRPNIAYLTSEQINR